MLTVAFVKEKLDKLMVTLNAKHIALDMFSRYLFGEYNHLDVRVFSEACLILSKKEFMRFPQSCHFKEAVAQAFKKYDDEEKKVVREQEVPDDDRPTREDWEVYWGKLSRAQDKFDARMRSMGPQEYKTDNIYMVEHFKKRNEEDDMKRQIREAKKRRANPNFKYQELK